MTTARTIFHTPLALVGAAVLLAALSGCQQLENTTMPDSSPAASPTTTPAEATPTPMEDGDEDEMADDGAAAEPAEELTEFEQSMLDRYNEMEAGVRTAQQRLGEMGEELNEDAAQAVAAFNVRMQAFNRDFQNLQLAAEDELETAQENASASLSALEEAYTGLTESVADAYEDFTTEPAEDAAEAEASPTSTTPAAEVDAEGEGEGEAEAYGEATIQ